MGNFVNEYVGLSMGASEALGWDESYSDCGNVERYSDSGSYDQSYEAYHDGR